MCVETPPEQNCCDWQILCSRYTKTIWLLFIYFVFNSPKVAIIPLIIYHVNVRFILIEGDGGTRGEGLENETLNGKRRLFSSPSPTIDGDIYSNPSTKKEIPELPSMNRNTNTRIRLLKLVEVLFSSFSV